MESAAITNLKKSEQVQLLARKLWIRGESNPCPKTHPVSFYYHSSLLAPEGFSRMKKENEHAFFCSSR